MNQKINAQRIVALISAAFPLCQAIYLFGSYATNQSNQNSDIDIAVLLPHQNAKQHKNLSWSDVHQRLVDETKKNVDLINLRLTTTVLQKEIISKGKCIFCSDHYAREEFEMLTLSFYQKLNQERKEILEDFYAVRNR